MEQGAREFFAIPGALDLLAHRYRSLPAGEHWARWQLLQLAGKADRQEAIQFLADEAKKPLMSADVSEAEQAHAMSAVNLDWVNRLSAGISIINSMPEQGTSQLEEVLSVADTSISRVLAAELFSRGLLSNTIVQLLQSRGVATEFRLMSRDEERAITAITPSYLHKDSP